MPIFTVDVHHSDSFPVVPDEDWRRMRIEAPTALAAELLACQMAASHPHRTPTRSQVIDWPYNRRESTMTNDATELYPTGTRLRARYAPRRTDDLKPGAAEMIGQTLEFVSDGQINAALAELDGSSYGGEYYFCPEGRWYDSGHEWWWIPSDDCQDIEVLALALEDPWA